MKGFGLIGYPLSHSFSKQYFTEKFSRESISDCYYKNFPIEEIEKLPALIAKHDDLIGLNVTIPYKERIIPYLHELDHDARSIGAVNTIKIMRAGDLSVLKGYNTDTYGFHTSIGPLLKPYHKNALVLGTGGAAKAVAFVLKKLNLETVFVSRNPVKQNQIAYHDLSKELFSDFQIIVNASPVGMYPDIHTFPDIPYQFLTSRHILFDLIYNPSETQFIRKGRSKGAIAVNGLEMLHLQAERAWDIWNQSG